MKQQILDSLTIIVCVLLVGATIVGSFYVAYNPKACPPAEMHEGQRP